MPRSPRPLWAGASYHVTARGNGGRHLFADDVDRRDFLRRFERVVASRGWNCLTYCLMGTHIHAAVVTPKGDLDQGMRDLLGRYARSFNRRHLVNGHLFRDRYGAVVIESDSQMVSTIAYILRNPVKAGLAESPEGWPWSNGAILLGYAPQRPRDVLGHRRALDWLGGDSDYARRQLQTLVTGDSAWDWRQERLGLLLGPDADMAGIARALEVGYSQVQIARYLGLAPSTLNRRLRSESNVG
jgi:putative transposase